MITHNTHPRRWIGYFLAAVASTVAGTQARASVGPQVEIKMPPGTQQAVSGQEYAGTFEVRVYQAGTLADFRIEGEGWTILEFQPPADPLTVDVSTVVIPFRAVASDADKPIGLTLTYDGRRVSQRYEIGPRHFTTARQGYRSQQIAEASSDTAPSRGGSCPADQIRCVGRIVYTRPDAKIVGADRIHVEVRDIDPVGHEIMWSGTTNVRGYFDTGCVDADIDGDGSGPDLVLYYETQTSWVDVTDNDFDEKTYWWDTGEIVDFGGNYYDFGLTTPAASSTHPAIHIFNVVTRTRRYVEELAGYTPSQVQVEWPVDEWTHYQPGPEEIHVQAQHQWFEDVVIHEYGHHFMHNYTSPPPTNYCNGFCDTSPPEDCGHCAWCPENASDAFNEGWPNWLADVMKRSLIQDDRYEFDNGDEYEPFDYFAPNAFEWVSTCGIEPVGDFGDAVMTEGFVAALLRDIEDDTQDDQDGDGIFDVLCLGAGPNFAVLVNDTPTTVTQFINAFINRYPDEIDGLWPTAFNIGGAAYTSGFPADTLPPGIVTVLDSPTHPLGVGGSLPCITFEWDAAPDDVTGATAYSYFLHQDPAGIEPDEGVDPVTLTDHCSLSARAPAGILGNWYFSIKARDSVGNWSSQWTTFGPFEVLDCNGSGLLDICDIDCLHTGEPNGGICEFAISPCIGEPGCGTISLDCNENLQPDECDIASGISEDCNNDSIPDECQAMKHFSGTIDNEWGLGGNWEELAAPVDDDHVCIEDVGLYSFVNFDQDYRRVASLTSELDLTIDGLSSPPPEIEIAGPSFIAGDLSMTGSSTLNNTDDLLVAGHFNWADGIMRGAGTTTVAGGMTLPASSIDLLGPHHLILSGGNANAGSRLMNLTGGAVLTIGPGVTYTYSGDFRIFGGGPTTTIDVDGTLLRAAGAGDVQVYSFIDNSGLIHVQTGELYLSYGGMSTGDVLGDPGTLLTFANGNYDWLPGSSLAGDDVTFAAGGASPGSTISGAVNITGTLTVGNPSAATVTFAADASITSYGQDLFARAGTVRFESPAAPPVDFDSVTVGQGNPYCGNPHFDTGEPVVINTLQLVCGNVYGADPITINNAFTWSGGGGFQAGGPVTCLGPVTIQATSSSRGLARDFNNTAHATFLGSFVPFGAGRFNNLATGTVDLQGDSTGLTGGQSTNAGTITKTAGAGRSTLAGMTNSGFIHAQTGEIYFYFNGENNGDILGDPGTLLTFNGTQVMNVGSSLAGDDVTFVGSTSTIRGDVDIAGTLTLGNSSSSATATFVGEANVTSYGHTLLARSGTVRFESPVTGPSLDFDVVTLGEGNISGQTYFDTGQPVNLNTLNLMRGIIQGADPITIHDAFTWGPVGSFFSGGAVTCLADSTIQSTTSNRTLARPFNNAGYATVLSPINLSNAVYTNLPAGTLDFQYNGSGFGLSTNSTLYNNGLLIKSAGSGVTSINVSFQNAGVIDVQTGALEMYGAYGQTYVQTAGQTKLSGGDLNLTSGATYEMLGGDLTGIGTVTGLVNNAAGTVMPGLSAGVLTIDGNYTQGAAATLAIEVGGSIQGADHDWLDVTGNGALAGTLEVTLIDGFIPNPGDMFEVVTAGAITGVLDSVVFTNPPGNLDLSVTYAANSVTIQTIGSVPGDCDGDGDVDLADYACFLDCLTGPDGGLLPDCGPFDFDSDSDVDLRDLAIFQEVFVQ